MLDSTSQLNIGVGTSTDVVDASRRLRSAANRESCRNVSRNMSRDVRNDATNALTVSGKNEGSQTVAKRSRKRGLPKRSLPKNSFLKRLDTLYWRRLFRYLFIRFLRIRSSPQAIARGMAAGAFTGSFPLLGIQSIAGIALAALFRGNKMVAAASTWISNPITFVPLFALNFQVGRWLLRLPTTTVLPSSSPAGLGAWMEMGLDVAGALMLGSCVVGLVMSVVGYYVGLTIAQRVRKAKIARRRRR